MSDVRSIGAYAAAKPVTPVVPAHTEKATSKTPTTATVANHGPAVKVTLSPEASKALEAARVSTPAKPTTVPVKHETTPVAKVAVQSAAKAAENHAALTATARK